MLNTPFKLATLLMIVTPALSIAFNGTLPFLAGTWIYNSSNNLYGPTSTSCCVPNGNVTFSGNDTTVQIVSTSWSGDLCPNGQIPSYLSGIGQNLNMDISSPLEIILALDGGATSVWLPIIYDEALFFYAFIFATEEEIDAYEQDKDDEGTFWQTQELSGITLGMALNNDKDSICMVQLIKTSEGSALSLTIIGFVLSFVALI